MRATDWIRGFLRSTTRLLRDNLLWWLLPVVSILLLIAVVALIGAFGGAVPPMYR